jgi:hypothetical protein
LVPEADSVTRDELKVPMLLPRRVMQVDPVIGTLVCRIDEIIGAK